MVFVYLVKNKAWNIILSPLKEEQIIHLLKNVAFFQLYSTPTPSHASRSMYLVFSWIISSYCLSLPTNVKEVKSPGMY